MQKNNASVGMLLILIAIVLLLGKLGVFHFLGYLLWPVFVLAPGLILHYLYFRRILTAAILVPGGMLVTYSAMFFYCNLFGWHAMSYLWPGFILGAAIGLYELYLFERNGNRAIFTAAVVLAVLSALFFGIAFIYALGVYLIALILIAVGALMVIRRPRIW